MHAIRLGGISAIGGGARLAQCNADIGDLISTGAERARAPTAAGLGIVATAAVLPACTAGAHMAGVAATAAAASCAVQGVTGSFIA